MIHKAPKKTPIGRKILGSVIVFEAVCFGVAYFAYTKANRDRDFRFRLKERFPWLLESYYRLGELGKKENILIRQRDEDAWSAKDQK